MRTKNNSRKKSSCLDADVRFAQLSERMALYLRKKKKK